jgi:hypothetical protein
MKSNAQLRRDDSNDEVPIPAAMPVGFLDMASSSQTVPPSELEVNYSQIMEALAAIQGGMSTMQVSMSSMQQSITAMQLEVHSINKLWSRTSWTSRSASSTIILTAVMMRMMHLGLHLWQRTLEFFFSFV